SPQRVGIRRRERLITLYRLFQIVRQKAPHPIDHPAHDRPSAPVLGAQDVSPSAGETSRTSPKNLVRTHCNLVHRANWRGRLSVLPIVSHKFCRTMPVGTRPCNTLDTMPT